MKKATFLLISLVLSAMYLQAQINVDFESDLSSYNITTFDGAVLTADPNPAKTGINTSATAGKIVRPADGEGYPQYAGIKVSVDGGIDFSLNRVLTVKAYSPVVGTVLSIKAEGETASTYFGVDKQESTVANEWEEFTFDFSEIDEEEYLHFVVMFDPGVTGDGAGGAQTYMIDDIVLSNPGGIDFDFEGVLADYANTAFDGADVSLVANPSATGENLSSQVVKVVRPAEFTGGYPQYAGNYFTIENPSINLSRNTTVKIKVYTPAVGTEVTVKMEGSTASVSYSPGSQNTTVANEWEELFFDFSDADGDYQKLVVMFDAGLTGDGTSASTYYYDDIQLFLLNRVAEGDPLGIDFEGEEVNMYNYFANYSLIDNPVKDGINPSAKVGQILKDVSQISYGLCGYETPLDSVDFSTSKLLKMKVLVPTADTELSLQILSTTGGSAVNTTSQIISTPNVWEEVEFDLTYLLEEGAAYQKIEFKFNSSEKGATDAENTYLIDDIMLEVSVIGVEIDYDFETSDYDFATYFTSIDVAANPFTDGINTSSQSMQIVKNSGISYACGGFYVNGDSIDFTSKKFIKMKVLSPRADSKLAFQIQNAEGGDIAMSPEKSIAQANVWEELVFDLTGIVDETKKYKRIYFLFDQTVEGDGSADFTYYIDDVFMFDGTTAITDNELTSLNVYSSKNLLYVNDAENFIDGSVNVYDITGKLVCSKRITQNNEVMNLQVNSGLFIVNVLDKSNQMSISKKIIVNM